MPTPSHRRDFFKTCFKTTLGGVTGLALSHRVFAQPAPATIKTTKLSDNLVMITGAGANVMLVLSPDGVLMVDGGLPDRSADLLKVVAEQSGQLPVRVLFNT